MGVALGEDGHSVGLFQPKKVKWFARMTHADTQPHHSTPGHESAHT